MALTSSTSPVALVTSSVDGLFPFAPAAEIIQSSQKDNQIIDSLRERLDDIIRSWYGATATHKYANHVRMSAGLLYYGLTTLLGNRTCGEEYCEVTCVSEPRKRVPGLAKRVAFILSLVLMPYGIDRAIPTLRKVARRMLKATDSNQTTSTGKSTIRGYLQDQIDAIISPTSIHVISMAAFYMTGSYYRLSNRVFGLRYVNTRQKPGIEASAGYEVLSVLLWVQIAVQTMRQIRHLYLASAGPQLAFHDSSEASHPLSQDMLIHKPKLDVKSQVAETASPPDMVRYDLADSTHFPWLQPDQQRKCTLCLEYMKDPSATNCGHVFCWSCVLEWIRQRPECPLCRQDCFAQHIMPLSN